MKNGNFVFLKKKKKKQSLVKILPKEEEREKRQEFWLRTKQSWIVISVKYDLCSQPPIVRIRLTLALVAKGGGEEKWKRVKEGEEKGTEWERKVHPICNFGYMEESRNPEEKRMHLFCLVPREKGRVRVILIDLYVYIWQK